MGKAQYDSYESILREKPLELVNSSLSDYARPFLATQSGVFNIVSTTLAGTQSPDGYGVKYLTSDWTLAKKYELTRRTKSSRDLVWFKRTNSYYNGKSDILSLLFILS